MFKFKYLIGFAACSALTVTPVMAQQSKCFTKDEASSMAITILPDIFDPIRKQCKTFLPANAALITKGDAALERYQAAADLSKTTASKAIIKLMGDDIPEDLDNNAIVDFTKAMFLMGLQKEIGDIDAEACIMINNIWAPIASVPPKSMVNFFVGLIDSMLKSEAKEKAEKGISESDDNSESDSFSSIKICPYIAS